MLIDAEKSTLLIIDMQERLLPAMHEPLAVERRCGILLKAARALDRAAVYAACASNWNS